MDLDGKRAGADRHPDIELERIAAGESTPADRERVVQHLLAGCRRCGERAARWVGPVPRDEEELAAAVDRATRRLPGLAAHVASESAEAEDLVVRLRKLPEPRRRLLIGNSRGARRRAVTERLIEESRRHRHTSAAEALAWAELAVLAAERCEQSDPTELRARAIAERGNARRIGGDLAGAQVDLTAAARLLAEGGADPVAAAELLSLQASLATHLRRFDEAVALLKRAAARYSRCEDLLGLARTLVQLGYVYGCQGEPQAGVPCLVEALKLLRRLDEPELRLMAAKNLVHLVAEAGDLEEAGALVARLRPAFAAAPILVRLRFEWVGARIERDLGQTVAAAARFERLRLAFADKDLPFEVALVSLDLLAVYAQQGRHGELRALAAETAVLFSRLGVGREHAATLGLLAQAKAAEAGEMVARLAAAVEAAEAARGRQRGDVLAGG
jgi:tetratricopeptide (TPR) repeat protein